MKKPLNETRTKDLQEFPGQARLEDLYQAGQVGRITTFGYRRGKERIYISIVAGETETRDFLEEVWVCNSPSPEIKAAVRREVKRQLSQAKQPTAA